MTELVGRNTWQQGLTLPLQGCQQQQQQRVCSEQSARLMPGQTGFNRQRGTGPSSVRMPRMELVVPAVGTVAYQLVSPPRMGCSSTFVSSAVSFAAEKKKMQQAPQS